MDSDDLIEDDEDNVNSSKNKSKKRTKRKKNTQKKSNKMYVKLPQVLSTFLILCL